MIIIYTDGGKAPVPEGWAVERVIEVLEECGHKVIKVEETDKETKEAV
jgi:hypothetical protein